MLTEQIHRTHGVARWRLATTVEADVTYGGPFWTLKGVAELATTDHVVADVHRQHIKLTQPSGRAVEFDKASDVVTVTEPDGTVARLEHPRATFAGFTVESQWSLPQACYFQAYATWLYLIETFVFTYAGVEVTEAEPWEEDGERWQVLRVTFPSTIDVHSTTQLYYFDDAGDLVRLDYEPDLNGGAPTAHYQPERTTVDGASITTKHEIFVRNEDRTPDRSFMPISVDVANLTMR
ncbi:hypothetical protein SAMN05421812_10733 [Asanoa hainanensis]|uniref:Uncharacterized protein n=1 Tax=Asanoa hainanensis TaxID=560556 RepID=A0A239MYU9_9ACTN|nr:hypothetical protein [Asanoa hainanensis]SNT47886.1 hypothetical protein SAMN05421812_10733 [Asanoa hainanensis]